MESIIEKELLRTGAVFGGAKERDGERPKGAALRLATKLRGEYGRAATSKTAMEVPVRAKRAKKAEKTERTDAGKTEGVAEKSAETAAETSSQSLVVRKETERQVVNYMPPGWTEAREELGKPQWHAPWKMYKVISGHQGWVRCAAVDVNNEWFATGSADRTIKIWDLASSRLKLTLTGHVGTVMSMCVSPNRPYLFSCSDDKTVKCWDLEQNKVVRTYHGHNSSVYGLSLHPTQDILVSGGRDCSARVWDMRTAYNIMVLEGHKMPVMSCATQATDPQVVTGSEDQTIRLWDLVAGKCRATLTHHKKAIRALAMHETEFGMVSGGCDKLKKWRFPNGDFMGNFGSQNTIVHSVAISKDNVVVSAGDNGSLYFWDWATGYNFQQAQTIPQPGSLESEAGIYGCCFDQTSTRLITCEADKTIKIWKQDETATPETHPVRNWRQRIDRAKF